MSKETNPKFYYIKLVIMEQTKNGGVFGSMGNLWAEIADAHHTQNQLKFLKCNLSPNKRVLDVACGTCRHTIPMS
ncbi:MAG: hypothetical protein GX799_02835, partial [Crenarchaeota archaeon]|nr:hypothetical protein [Thermoproteota archaeon]